MVEKRGDEKKRKNAVLECQNINVSRFYYVPISPLPKHFCVFNLLGLFIHFGDKLSQCYIQKSFLVICDYKKIWIHAKFVLLRPQLSPLPPPPNPVTSCTPPYSTLHAYF